MKNCKRDKHGLWAVVLKEGDTFIGDCVNNNAEH